MNETLLHCLITFGLSMIPIGELRVSIPYGVAVGLPLPWVILISVIGNMIPVPFIVLFIRRIFAWLRTKSQWLDNLVSKLEARAMEKSESVKKYKIFGLYVFVAIPLPGTGAWTGSLIGTLLNMRMKYILISCFFGVLTAGIIMSIASYGISALFSFI